MRTLELLDYLINLARRLEFEVREEWLEGAGTGTCLIRGKKVLFVDQSLTPSERLAQVAKSLCTQSGLEAIYILPEARAVLDRAA